MEKISKGTIIRMVVLILALTNQILTATGNPVIPIDSDVIAELISIVFTIAASGWAAWKNNSFTKTAIQADEYLKSIREDD